MIMLTQKRNGHISHWGISYINKTHSVISLFLKRNESAHFIQSERLKHLIKKLSIVLRLLGSLALMFGLVLIDR